MPGRGGETFRINPAFDRFPNEAQLIGKLLAGFGEIEFSVCRNAGHAARNVVDIIKALYRLRATSSRIDAADALARGQFHAANLGMQDQTAQTMVGICLRIRNQFAHCLWADHLETPASGLFFTDLQAAADALEGFEYAWRHIDALLLAEHEAYFALTMEWLTFLDVELAIRRKELSHRGWPKPPEQEPPPFHIPLEMHVPPWLTEDQKVLHVARALAARGGAPTPVFLTRRSHKTLSINFEDGIGGNSNDVFRE
jgi:hypothetical protein